MAPMSTVFLLLSAFGALSCGHEYRHNLFTVSFVLFPRRWPVIVGKVAGGAIMALLAVVGTLAVGVLATILSGHGHALAGLTGGRGSAGMLAAVLLRASVVSFGYLCLGFAFALIFGSLAAGIVMPFVLGSVIEPLLAIVWSNLGPSRYFFIFADARAAASEGGASIGIDGKAVTSDPWLALGCFSLACGLLLLYGVRRLMKASLVPQ